MTGAFTLLLAATPAMAETETHDGSAITETDTHAHVEQKPISHMEVIEKLKGIAAFAGGATVALAEAPVLIAKKRAGDITGDIGEIGTGRRDGEKGSRVEAFLNLGSKVPGPQKGAFSIEQRAEHLITEVRTAHENGDTIHGTLLKELTLIGLDMVTMGLPEEGYQFLKALGVIHPHQRGAVAVEAVEVPPIDTGEDLNIGPQFTEKPPEQSS
jgi:hypothetical protein